MLRKKRKYCQKALDIIKQMFYNKGVEGK